jgi:chromosome segregation ATPase
MSEYTDVLKTLPKKLVIRVVVVTVIFIGFLLLYVVVYRDRPVEIWGIKLGERDEELRQQLQKAQAEMALKIAPETHAAVLARLKEAESKVSQLTKETESRISQLNKDVGNLKVQLKQREDRASQLTKELEETNMTLGNARRDLQLAKDENQKLIIQLSELKKELDSSRLILTKKKIQALADDLAVLAKFGAISSNQGGFVDQYNNVLKSLKNELPNDFFIKSVQELDPNAIGTTVGLKLANGSQQLNSYLEKTYLK